MPPSITQQQFDYKGENDVTIILKPFPGAKRWQHYQRQQGPAGAELAIEDNYTVILGSHRNSKLKIEKNGDEKAAASGLPGCTVSPGVFKTCWINYAAGRITIGTGAAGSCMIFQWQDPEPAIPNIQHLGLSCWDTHVSYRNVQALHWSELLLPRTQRLYDAAIQLAGKWLECLVHQHLDEIARLSPEVLTDILQEPLLEISELLIYQAVAAWCQLGSEAAAVSVLEVKRPESQVLGALQLVRFAFMTDAERQEDLQRLRDSIGGSSPCGLYTCEQRRLVRPASAGQAAERSASAPAALPPVAAKEICSLALGFPDPTAKTAGAGAASTCPGLTAMPVTDSTSISTSSSWHPPACVPSPDADGSSSCMSVDSSKAVGRHRYRRRLAPSCKELMYVCDGDHNGVLYYIATEYGSKQWVNPVLSKAVEIKASSPPSRYTDPKAIVSGQFLNTSFAGPRYIRGCPRQAEDPAAAAGNCNGSTPTLPSTWWQLDLGPQHRLLCNYYTIRHDGCQDGFVRHWALQGSNDLQHWLDLRRHHNDGTIRLPGQYGSWPVLGPAAAIPFRAFRLLMLGPSNSHTSPWAFCLSYWELYGYFYKLSNDRPSHVSSDGVVGHEGGGDGAGGS
eukprot:gene5568-5805_t